MGVGREHHDGTGQQSLSQQSERAADSYTGHAHLFSEGGASGEERNTLGSDERDHEQGTQETARHDLRAVLAGSTRNLRLATNFEYTAFPPDWAGVARQHATPHHGAQRDVRTARGGGGDKNYADMRSSSGRQTKDAHHGATGKTPRQHHVATSSDK
ncbi:unnamed protein product, partial [Amoebophrya sp. A25]|eukprot:GSA25T00000704001.1